MGQVRILRTPGVLLEADSASLRRGPRVESASSLKMCFPTSQTQFFCWVSIVVKPPLQLRIEELLKLRLLNAVHQARIFLSRLSKLPKENKEKHEETHFSNDDVTDFMRYLI